MAVSDWKTWWLCRSRVSQVRFHLILFSSHFDQLCHWAEFQRVLPDPDGYDGVLHYYHITSLCTPMGFRNDHRLPCSEAFRQDRRACVPYHDSLCDWDRGLYYFPQHDEHCRTLRRLVSMLLFHKFSSDIPVRFLAAQSYAGFIVFFAWISTSIPRPPSKRAVALAFINAFSQLGNIAGSYVWPSVWGPAYRNSYAITLSCFGLGIVMTFIFREYLRQENLRFAVEEQKAIAQSGDVPHERQDHPAVPMVHGETRFRYLL